MAFKTKLKMSLPKIEKFRRQQMAHATERTLESLARVETCSDPEWAGFAIDDAVTFARRSWRFALRLEADGMLEVR